jgi:hypothetical protein
MGWDNPKGDVMKKSMAIFILIVLTMAGPVLADDFLGAPLRSKGQTTLSEKGLLEVRYSLPYSEMNRFYRDALNGQGDLVFRNRSWGLEIEDHGKRAWHKIQIAAMGDDGSRVTISRDSWTWIMGTLAIRFVGVFVVLLIVYLGMNASTWIIRRSIKAAEAKAGGKA